MKMVYQDSKEIELLNNCNKYGDYKICHITKCSDGELTFSKHYSVMEIWHDIEKLRWRLEKATDRTLYINEILLDVDMEKDMTKQDVINKTIKICKDLDERNVCYKLYSTGGNGYHIHLFIQDLALLNMYSRNEIRRKIIKNYECDMMKASEKMMILMENEPNRKTGNLKRCIEWQTLTE